MKTLIISLVALSSLNSFAISSCHTDRSKVAVAESFLLHNLELKNVVTSSLMNENQVNYYFSKDANFGCYGTVEIDNLCDVKVVKNVYCVDERFED